MLACEEDTIIAEPIIRSSFIVSPAEVKSCRILSSEVYTAIIEESRRECRHLAIYATSGLIELFINSKTMNSPSLML